MIHLQPRLGSRRTRVRLTARRWLLIAGLLAGLTGQSLTRADPIKIVAAENVYGGIAAQIGGAHVAVTSILTSPSQDPHEFEASASTARAMETARLVIYNGADYDPWAVRLLSASGAPSQVHIDVAKLVRKEPGDNPHLWYEPATVSMLADTLAAQLTQLDPEHGADYARGLATFQAAMRTLQERIGALRAKYGGTAVTATEPVFDYMADALGLVMRNGRFQLAVMNGTEPSVAAIVAFENDLRTHTVKVLLYNRQTHHALAERMRRLAGAAGVPVVTITETEPPGLSYPEWMLNQIDALEHALSEH